MAVNAANSPAAGAVAATAGVVNVDGVKTAAVGAMAMNPTQMCAAGTLKPGADIAINKAIQGGASLSQAFAPTFFTGKDGIKSLAGFAGNTNAQVSAATSLLSQGEAALKKTGLITGKESPTQTGGLILSAATAGINATVNFAKGAVSGLGNLASAAGSKISSLTSSLFSPSSAISSGNLAANMADKSLGSLSGAGIIDSVKGAVGGVFDKIADSYKALKARVPQSLLPSKQEATAAASKNSEGLLSGLPSLDTVTNKLSSAFGSGVNSLKNSATGALSTLAGGAVSSALKGTGLESLAGTASKAVSSGIKGLMTSASGGVPGLPSLPGGMSSVTNVVNGKIPTTSSIPGLSSVSGLVTSVTASISKGISSIGDTLASAKDKLLGAGGLTSLASKDLGADAKSKLDGALASMGSGGPADIKAPTVADETFSSAAIEAQTAKLLGDPRIPAIPFGASKIPPIG